MEVNSSNEIIDYKTQVWKIQLTMVINFISSKDSDEIGTIQTESHNIEIVIRNEIDKVIGELLKFFLQKCQEGLEKK